MRDGVYGIDVIDWKSVSWQTMASRVFLTQKSFLRATGIMFINIHSAWPLLQCINRFTQCIWFRFPLPLLPKRQNGVISNVNLRIVIMESNLFPRD